MLVFVTELVPDIDNEEDFHVASMALNDKRFDPITKHLKENHE